MGYKSVADTMCLASFV